MGKKNFRYHVSKSKKLFLLSIVHCVELIKLIFVGGISGTPQLGIVLEDHQDSLDEGSGVRLYQKKYS